MNYKAVGKLGNTINLKIFHYNIVISFSMSHIDFRSPSETFRVNYLKFNFLMIFLFFFFFSFFFCTDKLVFSLYTCQQARVRVVTGQN